MDPAVRLEGVTKRYASDAQAVTALCDVTFEVSTGEFLAVTGPSGCGKSTLLNLVAGIETPTAGRVVTLGHDLNSLSDAARSDLRLRHIGFVFQSFNLFPNLSAEENVAWSIEFLGLRWREARRRANIALEEVGIETQAQRRRPPELSGGEQQRVAIARSLGTEPKLILADEPTGNLDSRTGQAILDLLRALNRDRRLTVVLVTHSHVAAAYATYAVELSDGRVVRNKGAACPDEASE